MYEDVAEPGDAAEASGKIVRQDTHLGETVDASGIVRNVVAGARRDLGRRVEGILGA